MEELARVLFCIVHEKRFSKGIVGRAIQHNDHFFFHVFINLTLPPESGKFKRLIQTP